MHLLIRTEGCQGLSIGELLYTVATVYALTFALSCCDPVENDKVIESIYARNTL